MNYYIMARYRSVRAQTLPFICFSYFPPDFGRPAPYLKQKNKPAITTIL